jgi:hypothetical protein
MAANRVSGVTLEVLHPGVAKARISGLNMEVLRAVDRSYGNGGGKGNRISGIDILLTGSFHRGGGATSYFYDLIDGSQANGSVWFTGTTGLAIVFDFREARVIDEATWYQDTASAQGVWKWQGSVSDGTTWIDIGGTFTLGSTATQVHTSLNANTTAYRFYRLLMVSGTANSTPFLREIEFSINPVPAQSYFNTGGQGDRSASIPTVTTTAITNGLGNVASMLVDGNIQYNTSNALYISGGQTLREFKFDFGVGALKRITEMKLRFRNSADNDTSFSGFGGTWKVAASNDDSTYDDITTGIAGIGVAGAAQQIIDMSTNLYGYRYYKLIQTAGTTTNSGTEAWSEVAFQIGNGSAPPVVTGANLRNLLIVN